MDDNTMVKNRIGEIRTMNCGEECEVIEYNSVRDIKIKFIKTGEVIRATYSNFKKGSIKSHFTPTVYGIGIVGMEKTKENGKILDVYDAWKSMLERCYSRKYIKKFPTYNNCYVCETWLYYPNFKKWYDENYYNVNNEKMCLDKDILIKGNKIYSPTTCCFVPSNINNLFTKSNAARGEFPIGVCWNKQCKKFMSYCNTFDINSNKSKLIHFGLYNTSEEAFNKYKKFKENYIKEVANHYKDKIPKRLYNAMYRYKVEITD